MAEWRLSERGGHSNGCSWRTANVGSWLLAVVALHPPRICPCIFIIIRFAPFFFTLIMKRMIRFMGMMNWISGVGGVGFNRRFARWYQHIQSLQQSFMAFWHLSAHMVASQLACCLPRHEIFSGSYGAYASLSTFGQERKFINGEPETFIRPAGDPTLTAVEKMWLSFGKTHLLSERAVE